MSDLYDKHGIPIERGDVLKVFHFTGARRKRHYMYKQAIGICLLGTPTSIPFMKISHLSLANTEFHADAEYYWERADGDSLPNYEIVQSLDTNFEERERKQ